ncbi:sensor histidine kinase, partial [Chloroflexota bacterium]
TELAVPLVLRGEVIGVLGVKREEETRWAEEEVAAVEAVANQVTQALENARLSKEREKTIVQLKEVDRLKDEFLTGMSHELRTPLNSIIGFADVILQGIDGEVSEMAMNDIRLIHNSGQHLLTLINDILDLAKIEAGKMELVCEPLSIEETIRDVMASTNALIKSKPVEVVLDIVEGLPPIYADKLRLTQILINLVSNAAKFTEEGLITIKADKYEIDPHLALISVADQGIGIPPQMVDTIFDRFRQIASVSTRKTGGTGLGLPICKQLVELHGGAIEVTSEEGVGSNFHFTIPFVDANTDNEALTTDEMLAIDAAK